MNNFAQGDITFIKVEKPLNTGRVMTEHNKNGRFIVGYGEVTGHTHAIQSDTATLYEVDGERYLDAPHGFTVIHEEHAAITAEPGVYKIGQVFERDHLAELTRNVRD